MGRIVTTFHRFRKDEHGAFAVVFAVIAIALIAMGGAAVDFTSIQQARGRTQAALDAAALALQPTIFNTGVTAATIKPLAQKLVTDQLADGATTWVDCTTNGSKAPCATVITPVIDTVNGTLTLTANLRVQMNFVALVGVTSIPAQIVSVATRKKLALEVALVLDNSGSMGTSFGTGTRMTTLQSSAICASQILYYGVTTCNDPSTNKPWTTAALPSPSTSVKFALVPFNDEVNVGTANASATWLDRTGGAGTYDNDNFDNDDYSATPYAGTTDRITLFSKIKDKNGNALSWGGCVEARVNNGSTEQYDTDDTTPDSTKPDTMFVPLFAPDNPDSGGFSNNYISDTPSACNWTGTCSTTDTAVATTNVVTTTTVQTVTKKNSSGVITSGPTTTTTTAGPTTTTTTNTTNNSTFTATFGTQQSGSNICSCPNAKVAGTATTTGPTTTTSVSGPTTTTSGKNTVTTTTTTVTTQTVTSAKTTPSTAVCSGQTYTPTGLSARVLQERLCKYTSPQMTKSVSASNGFGPNADCPANAITPLTTTPATITTAINNMVAMGNTNIQEGAAWGFRVLSPTAPFTEGGPYNSSISKVMIVMTDGENTYNSQSDMNGASLYAAYSYPYNNYDRDTYGASAPSRGRMGDVTWSDSNFESAINARLATTCTNAKAAGITVYTIGLATNATSDPTGNTTLLTNCATPTGTDGKVHYFFPTTATALQDAFVNIANQLSDLRISQ